MKTHHHTTTTYTIPGTEIEVELPFEPDLIMEYKEPLVRITDDQIILGYLAHDDDCDNPLEDCDGMGHIYEARRHGSTLSDYEQALGLTDGGPDLDLVDEDVVVKRAHDLIFADPELLDGAVRHCLFHWGREESQSDADLVETCLDSLHELAPVIDVYAIQKDLWEEGRRDGTIGNKYAVMLDVYEHGGISYSLSGQGMQCQFDTARGGAVFVPDVSAMEEIQRRGEVYRKGDVNELRGGKFEVRTLREGLLKYDDQAHPTFDHWYQAFEYLKDLQPAHLRDLATAEHIAARELAKQAAEQYTGWRNGSCFFTVVVTYDKDGNQIDYDTCGGYVGDEWAYESLKNDYFPKEEGA